mmetsp:Transcript_1120/g.3385  ORF Transcript_1120/g.3385 Transcript_1120/m.3385 type:complete len:228 (+) Transcript_1120:1240-1923(+)
MRARLMSSLILRTALLCGSDLRSAISSVASASNRPELSWSLLRGWPQNEPMYTRRTSGELTTLPRLHISAPYTRMSCFGETESALLRTTRTLSSWPLSAAMERLSSSEISSLCASKSSRMRSAREANHSMTAVKSYWRSTRCFSPESTPGVSTRIMFSRMRELHTAPSKRLRNVVPNLLSARKGLSAATHMALPGMIWSCSPCMTHTKRSVVGSGPTRMPGKSRSMR